VAMARGGQKFVAASASAVLARNDAEFVEMATDLAGDAGRRRAMGAAARESALQRSWSAVFDAVYDAYAVAIASARRDLQDSDGSFVAIAEEQSA